MFILKLNLQCCGINIKTATKMIAIFNTFAYASIFFVLSNAAHALKEARPGLIGGAVVIFIPLIINGLLVFAVYKKKSSLFVPWMAFEAIFLAIKAFAFVLCVGAMTYGTFFHPFVGLSTSICLLPLGAWIAIHWYIVSIVYNHYESVKRGEVQETGEFENLQTDK